MRWEELFADLAGRWDADERADFEAEVEDRARAAAARTSVVDRFREAQAQGARVRLRVRGGRVVAGRVLDVGRDWVWLASDDDFDALVPVAGLVSAEGLTVRADLTAGAVARSLGLGQPLRALARRRVPVEVSVVDGDVVVGRVVRVGADALDVVRDGDGDIAARTVTVPFAAVGYVRGR